MQQIIINFFFIFLIVACSFSNVVYAQKTLTPRVTKNSLGVKVGYHFYQDSDFTDFYHAQADALGTSFEGNDFNLVTVELAYDRKFIPYLGIEVAFGYAPSTSKTYSNVLEDGDSFRLKLHNIYFAPSLKGYLPIGERFSFYGGAGPDFNLLLGKVQYRASGGSYSPSDELFGFGFHGLVGAEWWFYRHPPSDEYQAAVSFFVEYKYSWVIVSDADQKPIEVVNLDQGTNFSAHDLNVGGHNIFGGLRWHF